MSFFPEGVTRDVIEQRLRDMNYERPVQEGGFSDRILQATPGPDGRLVYQPGVGQNPGPDWVQELVRRMLARKSLARGIES